MSRHSVFDTRVQYVGGLSWFWEAARTDFCIHSSSHLGSSSLIADLRLLSKLISEEKLRNREYLLPIYCYMPWLWVSFHHGLQCWATCQQLCAYHTNSKAYARPIGHSPSRFFQKSNTKNFPGRDQEPSAQTSKANRPSSHPLDSHTLILRFIHLLTGPSEHTPYPTELCSTRNHLVSVWTPGVQVHQ